MIVYDLEIVKAIPPRDGIFLEDIEYCLHDVWLARLLLNLIQEGQFDLIDPKTRKTLRLRPPGLNSH